MILGKKMANRSTSRLNSERLKRQVFWIPRRSICVANSCCLRFCSIISNKWNFVSLDIVYLVAIKHTICLVLLVRNHAFSPSFFYLRILYFCILLFFSTSVDSALTLFPNLEVVKSIIFSGAVAQYFSSPLIPGASHTVIVFFIALDSNVFSFIENLVSIYFQYYFRWEWNGVCNVSRQDRCWSSGLAEM